MPKQVDYATRIQFVREAAFQVVWERGVAEPSRRSVAAVLGTSPQTIHRAINISASLPTMAATLVAQRRRHQRWLLRGQEPIESAHQLACSLLPDARHRVAEELVWWRLVVDQPRPVPREPITLREAFQIADRGWAEEPSATPDCESPDHEIVPDERLQLLIDEREAQVSGVLDQVMNLLQVPEEDREGELIALRACLDGLSLAVCLSRLDPDVGVGVARRHLERLASAGRG